jgi:hypothetical protein
VGREVSQKVIGIVRLAVGVAKDGISFSSEPHYCVASPSDIGTLEAGGKTNVKSGKVKFFLFSLYSTFC